MKRAHALNEIAAASADSEEAAVVAAVGDSVAAAAVDHAGSCFITS
jgi:hypothetical protein